MKAISIIACTDMQAMYSSRASHSFSNTLKRIHDSLCKNLRKFYPETQEHRGRLTLLSFCRLVVGRAARVL